MKIDTTNLLFWFYLKFRPIVKYVIRFVTGQCELQRICYGSPDRATRTICVEQSLSLSRQSAIRDIVTTLDIMVERKLLMGEQKTKILQNSVIAIADCKKVQPKEENMNFLVNLQRSMDHIWTYRQLIEDVIALTRICYDPKREDHEVKLLTLWKLLMPDTPLQSRVSKQWQEIGFQGDDPKTDFRGMGILGLDNLLFFTQEHMSNARLALSRSTHPTKGYAFAIVGINITSLACDLLKDGTVKYYFYSIHHTVPKLLLFNHLYSFLFTKFDKFWKDSNPQSIMDFAYIRQNYELYIRQTMKNNPSNFNIICP